MEKDTQVSQLVGSLGVQSVQSSVWLVSVSESGMPRIVVELFINYFMHYHYPQQAAGVHPMRVQKSLLSPAFVHAVLRLLVLMTPVRIHLSIHPSIHPSIQQPASHKA